MVVNGSLMRSRWALGVLLLLTAANAVRFFAFNDGYDLTTRTITDGLETVIVLFGTVACLVAMTRSSHPARALWATTALYFAATALGDAHDFLIDLGIRRPIVLSVTEIIGWFSYLPLAFLVFFPLTDPHKREPRWLPFLDFAQVTIAIALLYFHLVYLPHAQTGVHWITAGSPERVRNVLISVGLLLRAGLDPSRQARAVYRRVGGAFGLITISYLLLGRGTVVIRPSMLLGLGLLALLWRGGPEEERLSLRGLMGSRLVLSMFAAANLIVVVLLTSAAPDGYRPAMYLIAVVSTGLFIGRAILAESTRFSTERELRTSEERYAKTFRASPDGIAIRDLGSEGLVEVNERFATMLGYAPRELLGRTMAELGIVAQEDAAEFISRIDRAGSVRDFEFVARRKDGGHLQMLASAERVEIGGRRCGLAVFRDISAQKKAEAEVAAAAEEMRQLYVRLATVEDDDRRVLHAELHDRVGANLAALRLELEVAAGQLSRGEGASAEQHLLGAREVAAETIALARDLMAELRPPALDDYGLVAALRTFAGVQSSRLGLPIEVAGEDLAPRPSLLLEGALFRIAHEAVINAARHASASRVAVSVGERDGHVILTVEDDGVGFDLDAPGTGPDHWGLKNMRERARAIGGILRVETAPGAGTRVTAEAPREAS